MALGKKTTLTREDLSVYDKDQLLDILEDYIKEMKLMEGELYEYEEIISARCR